MKRFARLTAIAVAIVGGSALAISQPRSEQATREIAPPPREVPKENRANSGIGSLQVVAFAPSRPVRIEVQVSLHGKSLRTIWLEKLRKAFDFFDRDKNGTLDDAELQNIFSDSGLALMLLNGFYQPTPLDRATLEHIDLNVDGKVSFEEFAAYYKMALTQLIRIVPPRPLDSRLSPITETLFKLLDTNADGKLTENELRAAEKLLPLLDLDEDECISSLEVTRSRFAPKIPQTPVVPKAPQEPADKPIVFVFPSGRIPETLLDQLIRKYDRNGDSQLDPSESGFDAATFARLDRDGNGKLDARELEAWLTGAPDLDFSLSLASHPKDCAAKLATDPAAVAARGFAVHRVDTSRSIVRAAGFPIEFWAFPIPDSRQGGSLRMRFADLFARAANAKDYVAEQDLKGPNAVPLQLLSTMFDAADANGDGKLTKAEFEAYLDLQEEFRGICLAVEPPVWIPTLFQLLDANRDGRLSVRELRSGWERLVALAPPGSTAISRTSFKPTVSIHLVPTFDNFYQSQDRFTNQLHNPNMPIAPSRGPLWFRKMDRNGDGDVSRSEFLGSKEDFDAIDTDRDGLISAEEAEAYDRKMRKASEKTGPGDGKRPYNISELRRHCGFEFS